MSKDSLLKKDFKGSDLQRIRNLVKKEYNNKTKILTGYTKEYTVHKEGDIWEENEKKWTIKDGVKQNVTKLDSIKSLARIPLTCPKCNGPLSHHLDIKMYKIHRMCFTCTVQYEDQLKIAGLYEAYEKSMMQENAKSFIKDLEEYIKNSSEESSTFITEQGDVEEWNHNKEKHKENINRKLKEYIEHVNTHVV